MSKKTSIFEKLSEVELTLLEVKFELGRNPLSPWDGGHFAIPGTERPLSISRIEAKFLANLTILLNPNNVLEIGTGFGYSSTWFAHGLSQLNKVARIYTVDDWSEGQLGHLSHSIATQLWKATGAEQWISPITGSSPQIFKSIKFPQIDIAFIDGEHRKAQPSLDYKAVKELLTVDGVIIFHDAQEKYDVNEAIKEAEIDGFRIIRLNTSCEPAIAIKNHAHDALVVRALDLAKNGLLVGSTDGN